jgi:hypothetical protein
MEILSGCPHHDFCMFISTVTNFANPATSSGTFDNPTNSD